VCRSAEIQELVVFKSMFLLTSRANMFYKFLLTQYMKCAQSSNRNIMHRIRFTCDKYDIPFSEYICYGSYMKTIKHNLKKVSENGIADSVSFSNAFLSICTYIYCIFILFYCCCIMYLLWRQIHLFTYYNIF